jgi:hypothetical protein
MVESHSLAGLPCNMRAEESATTELTAVATGVVVVLDIVNTPIKDSQE